MKNVLIRAWQSLRHEGRRSFWFKLLERLGYRRVLLMEGDLNTLAPAAPLPAGVEIRPLTQSEWPAYQAWRPDTTGEDFQLRIQRGDRCFVAWDGSHCVACTWVTTWRARYLCDLFPLAAGDVFLYDTFTDPVWRGRGLSPALSRHLHNHYRAAGSRRLIRAIFPENSPARRANEKAGFHVYAFRARLKIGRWQKYFSS